jgi:hypothetical protein
MFFLVAFFDTDGFTETSEQASPFRLDVRSFQKLHGRHQIIKYEVILINKRRCRRRRANPQLR